jgi:hypothetical protein
LKGSERFKLWKIIFFKKSKPLYKMKRRKEGRKEGRKKGRGRQQVSKQVSRRKGREKGERERRGWEGRGGEGRGGCLLYTSPSPRDASVSRMPSSA